MDPTPLQSWFDAVNRWSAANPGRGFVALVAAVLVLIIFFSLGRALFQRRPTQSGRRTSTPGRIVTASKRRMVYRTRDGRFLVGLSFEQMPSGHWRVYVESPPPYSQFGRDESAHATHRLSEGGRSYICWDRPIPSCDEALAIARMWCEASGDYLLTGRRF